MGRTRWFIAGAVAAAGALVAAGQVRRLLGSDAEPMLDAPDVPTVQPADAVPPPATAFAAYDAPAQADDDTKELRLRIDETRDRIRRRTQDAATDADPAL